MGTRNAEGVGGHDLLDRLGGDETTVHRAVERGSGRVVVVKSAPWERPAAAAALGREAAVLTRVTHRNLVRLRGTTEDETGRTVVLTHAPGGSLRDRLRSDGPLAPAEVAELGAAIAAALGSLHAAGVVHRDVHPGNVLFDAELVPLLADLDHALDPCAEPVPWDDQVVGHPGHVDPRVLAGAAPDAEGDLHALATTLWTAATGAPPTAPGPSALGGDERRLPPHPAVPPSLHALLVACLDGSVGGAAAAAASFGALVPTLSTAALGCPTGADGREHDAPGPPAAPARPPRGGTASPRTAVLAGGGGDTLAGATRRFGPRPDRSVGTAGPHGPAGRPRGWWHAFAGAVGALVLVTIALLAPDDEPPAVDVVEPEVRATPCDGTPEAGDAPLPDGAVLADVDGDGCGEPLRLDAGVLHTPDGSYRVGEPGDRLLAGDWDGDGTWSPGLYRPRTGEVFLFDPAPGGDTWTSRPARVHARHGHARVVDVDRDGRHEVEVLPAADDRAAGSSTA